MNTPAIQQAIRLSKYPDEMAWLCQPDSEFPEGVTDLLRLCASEKQMTEFSKSHKLNKKYVHQVLLNFIQKAILTDGNSSEKILGTDQLATRQLRKLHYQLLMKIYHPDVNQSADATHYSAMISKAYQEIKNPESVKIQTSGYRTPPKSFYRATQKAEQQISNIRTAIAVVSVVTIMGLVAIAGHIYDPANPELVAKNTDRQVTPTNNISSIAEMISHADNNQFGTATLVSSTAVNHDVKLQNLLRNLEFAYEKGNVELIKPILANTPEIRGQTDQQISEKLNTLFEITSERKMLLYNFNWKNVSGEIKGNGKFLSRYHLTGEKLWLTREGNAIITAQKSGKGFQVTGLELENQTTEQ